MKKGSASLMIVLIVSLVGVIGLMGPQTLTGMLTKDECEAIYEPLEDKVQVESKACKKGFIVEATQDTSLTRNICRQQNRDGKAACRLVQKSEKRDCNNWARVVNQACRKGFTIVQLSGSMTKQECKELYKPQADKIKIESKACQIGFVVEAVQDSSLNRQFCKQQYSQDRTACNALSGNARRTCNNFAKLVNQACRRGFTLVNIGAAINLGGIAPAPPLPPVEPPCVDPDAGANELDAFTTVTKGTASSTDSCDDSQTLREYYCYQNQIESKIIICPTGYSCSPSGCVAPTPPPAHECLSNSDCASPSCASSSTIVYEACVENTQGVRECVPNQRSCKPSAPCVNGVCVTTLVTPPPTGPTTCEDPDGEDYTDWPNFFVQGTTSYLDRSETDSCDGNVLREWYCSTPEEIWSMNSVCAADRHCEDGACRIGAPVAQVVDPAATCIDPDTGANEIDYSTTVTKGTASSTDSCTADGYVLEYYCQNNEIAAKYLTCPADKVCMKGRCITPFTVGTPAPPPPPPTDPLIFTTTPTAPPPPTTPTYFECGTQGCCCGGAWPDTCSDTGRTCLGQPSVLDPQGVLRTYGLCGLSSSFAPTYLASSQPAYCEREVTVVDPTLGTLVTLGGQAQQAQQATQYEAGLSGVTGYEVCGSYGCCCGTGWTDLCSDNGYSCLSIPGYGAAYKLCGVAGIVPTLSTNPRQPTGCAAPTTFFTFPSGP